MKNTLSIAAIVALAASLASTAAAGGSKPPAGCIQWNQITKVCKVPAKKGPVVTPVAHPLTPPNGGGTTPPPGGGTTPPPVVTPGVPAPPINSQEPVEAFCVQTLQRGETFVQANPGAFDPDGAWYPLFVGQATVILDGQSVTLLYEGGKGVILAALVPGVGLTCAQPYVSTDGVYQNPAFGLRGADWAAAFPNA